MIVLRVNRILKFHPINWEGESILQGRPGWALFHIGSYSEHPNNPEEGFVELSTSLLAGDDMTGMSEVMFIDTAPVEGTIVEWKKSFSGNIKIKIKLHSVFRHGLKYSAKYFIQNGGGIICMSKEDRLSIKTLQTQKELLNMLAALILPERQLQINNMALMGYLLIPTKNEEKQLTHFFDIPKSDKMDIVYNEGSKESLYHLATINLNDFNNQSDINFAVDKLSFHLGIHDTENGWPGKNNEFKVLSHQEKVASKIFKYPKGTLKKYFIAKEFLDIPGSDHSKLVDLKFSTTELLEYELLFEVYKALILKNEEMSNYIRFLGYPDSSQGCVAYDAERYKYSIEFNDVIIKDAIKWKLLLQVSPHYDDFNFFDVFGYGTICFMIREDDLKNQMFDNVQLVVQNT